MTDVVTDEGRQELRTVISSNASVAIASRALYMVTRVFLPPIILSYIDLEAYGVWAYCFIIISYLGTSALGVSNVYVKYVAQYNAQGEHDKINRLVSTGIMVVVLIAIVLLTALWFALPWIIDVFQIPSHLRDAARVLLFATAATFMLDMSFGAFAFVLHGLQRIVQVNIVWVCGFTLEAVLIVAFLMMDFGVFALLFAFVIRYALAMIAYIVLAHRAIPTLRLSPRLFCRDSLRLFYSYGAVVQLTSILATFLYSLEKIIGGYCLGVRATGLIEVGQKIPVMASQVPSSMTPVFFPAIAHMHSLKQQDEIVNLYLRGCRYLAILTGIVMGYLAAFAPQVLTLWLGAATDAVSEVGHKSLDAETMALVAFIFSCFTIAYHINEITGPGSIMHRGVGRPDRELVYCFLQLGIVAVTVSLAFIFFGVSLITITVAVASGMVLSALVYMVYTNRILGVSQWAFARGVLAPAIAPYFVGFAAAGATMPWSGWAMTGRLSAFAFVMVSGVGYMLVVTPLLLWGMCGKDERMKLWRLAWRVVGNLRGGAWH